MSNITEKVKEKMPKKYVFTVQRETNTPLHFQYIPVPLTDTDINLSNIQTIMTTNTRENELEEECITFSNQYGKIYLRNKRTHKTECIQELGAWISSKIENYDVSLSAYGYSYDISAYDDKENAHEVDAVLHQENEGAYHHDVLDIMTIAKNAYGILPAHIKRVVVFDDLFFGHNIRLSMQCLASFLETIYNDSIIVIYLNDTYFGNLSNNDTIHEVANGLGEFGYKLYQCIHANEDLPYIQNVMIR